MEILSWAVCAIIFICFLQYQKHKEDKRQQIVSEAYRIADEQKAAARIRYETEKAYIGTEQWKQEMLERVEEQRRFSAQNKDKQQPK